MDADSKTDASDAGKEQSAIIIKSLYEITVKEIKDPILRAVLAVGVLFVALAGLSMLLKANIPKSAIWPLFSLGVVIALFGVVKWVMGVVFENGKEKRLGELRRLLRPAKTIRGSDLIQEMGLMIYESSNEPFIADMAQRIAEDSLRKMGEKTKLPDLMKLYEKKEILPADRARVKRIAQSIADKVSWKRHRVYVDQITREQILQYPSTMLLSDEIYGGCMDKVVLLCTLLRAVGFRVRFRSAINKNRTQAHVWAEVYLPTEQGDRQWSAVDPSMPGFQIAGKDEWEKHWNKNLAPGGYPASENSQVYELS